MPIDNIELTDSFATWLDKDNEMIDRVNSLSQAGDVISSDTPEPGQILVYDGEFFRNITVTGDLSMDENGVATVSESVTGATKGRTRFIGSMSVLY